MRCIRVVVGLAMALSAFPLIGQYPGGYPPGGYPPGGYPPGGYPPGTYPGGGGGIGGIGLPRLPGRKPKKTATPKDSQEQLQQVTGTLRQLDDKQIVIEADDTRILTLKRTDKTKAPSDLHPGDHLVIDAKQDEEGYLYAVNVTLKKKGTAEEQAKASEPVRASTQTSQSDDERPVLRHKDASSAAESAPATAQAAATEAEASPPAKASAAAKAPAVAPAVARAPAPAAPATAKAPTAARVPGAAKAPAAAAEASAPAETAEATSAPEPPPQAPNENDAGRPRLRRGWSKDPEVRKQMDVAAAGALPDPATAGSPVAASPRRAAATAASSAEVEVIPAPDAPPADPHIAKAREIAGSFTETLPNYVCQEFMARFASVSHKVSWQAQDVVSVNVVYEGGRERYRDVAINGKPTKKGIEDLPGSWSTGEFGTILVDLFSPGTAADFRYREESKAGGQTALVYDFEVEREGSHWNIMVASQSVLPAYDGAVWIDKKTHRVLRIEMQAKKIPREFPLDRIESATDYEYVRLGDGQYLLPVHSESLSCQRGTSACSRNTIDFRNYHKYTSESDIIFTNTK